jgi:hypothetical protein
VLTGTVTDSVGLEEVQISTAGGPWDDAAFNYARGEWRYLWYLGTEPDGASYAVTTRASDAGSHVTQITQTVAVDLAPPSPVTVTLAYTNGAGVFTTLAPGQTIRDVYTPTVIITWTASSDGVGLGNYLVGWTPNSHDRLTLCARQSLSRDDQALCVCQVIAPDIWQRQGGQSARSMPMSPPRQTIFRRVTAGEQLLAVGANRDHARIKSSCSKIPGGCISWDDVLE